MGKVEDSFIEPKMSAPAPTEDYDIVKRASATRISPAYCRVPGDLAPVGKMKHELETFKNELKKKSLLEVKDMLVSHNKISQNTLLMSRLPDKGQKVKAKLDIIKELVKEKESADDLVLALAALKLPGDCAPLPDINAMEWKTKSTVMKADQPLTEGEKSLKVLSEGTIPSSEQDEEQFDQDLDNPQYLSHKVQVLDTVASKDRFVPANYLQNFTIDQLDADAKSALPGNQNAIVGKSDLSRKKCVVKTDPIPLPKYSNSASKQLTLKESLTIQQQQAEKLREATLRQAAARLAAKSQNKSTGSTNNSAVALTSTDKVTISALVDTRWRDTTTQDSDDSENEATEEHHEIAAAQKLVKDAAKPTQLDSDDDDES